MSLFEYFSIPVTVCALLLPTADNFGSYALISLTQQKQGFTSLPSLHKTSVPLFISDKEGKSTHRHAQPSHQAMPFKRENSPRFIAPLLNNGVLSSMKPNLLCQFMLKEMVLCRIAMLLQKAFEEILSDTNGDQALFHI